MVPQGIRPVVQLTAVEVRNSLHTLFVRRYTCRLSQNILNVYADSCMGPEKHEDIPAGCSVLTQSGCRVWWADGGVRRDQEYEKEPKLPQLCPVDQSGTQHYVNYTSAKTQGKNTSLFTEQMISICPHKDWITS